MRVNQSETALNWLNFFSADVATGFGPFLAGYLAANRHWAPGKIGIAIAAMSFATVFAQSPVGYFVDKTTYKKATIVIASIAMGASGIAMFFSPRFQL